MRTFNAMAIVAAGIVLSAGQAFAQTVVAPTAGCTATPAQLEANKKVAMAFFAPNADRVSVLLSRESRRKCGEEAAPPSYDVLEIIAKGGEVRDRVAPLPPQACDTDVSQPDLEVTPTETRVRWFDTKEEDHSRRMHAWTLPAGGTGKGIARPVAVDSVWTDCERGCAAVAREGTSFKVVEAKSE